MAKTARWPEMLDWKDVRTIFKCSRTRAYEIIRDTNKELDEKNMRTCRGRVSTAYLFERYGITFSVNQ